MDFATLEWVFSTDRLQPYLAFYKGDQKKATLHYQANLKISESFYTVLSLFEVALRNSLNRELSKLFGTHDWYLHLHQLNALDRTINRAKNQILKRDEVVSSAKVIAELTPGFWISLFNAEYERTLWKDLRRAFPFLEKRERQRHRVSVPLNRIRNFRNRVYHNEPIAWNMQSLELIHNEIMEVLGWINRQLPEYAQSLSRFPTVLQTIKEELEIK